MKSQPTIRRWRRARAVIGWGALVFLAIQTIASVIIECKRPYYFDPEYGTRLTLLKERIAEAPDRPLLLVVGSSRIEMNFVPELLPPLKTPSGEEALPFNFAHLAAGPAMNYLEVERLVRNGIRPKWIVLEIMPGQLCDPDQRILHATATAADLPVVSRYYNPFRLAYAYCRLRLTPAYDLRRNILHELVPDWIIEKKNDPWRMQLEPLGGDISWQAIDAQCPEVVQKLTRDASRCFEARMRSLYIADISNRTLNELLELCGREDIQVVLLLTPEGSAFQSWYSPASRQLVNDYTTSLSRRYGVPLVDARNWLADEDFVDSHHCHLRGARKFTHRLCDEVLKPLVERKLVRQDTVP